MALLDDTETVDYVHPEWEAGSVWTLRRFKLKPDEEKIASLAYDYQMPKFTPRQVREARRQGRDLTDGIEITQVQKMSPSIAEMWWMSEGWDGPEFVVPKTFKARDANGKPIIGEDGKPVLHELAGKPAPCTAEWIARIEPHQFDDAHRHMTMIWEGGDEDPEDFRQTGTDSPESEGTAVAEGRDALTA